MESLISHKFSKCQKSKSALKRNSWKKKRWFLECSFEYMYVLIFDWLGTFLLLNTVCVLSYVQLNLIIWCFLVYKMLKFQVIPSSLQTFWSIIEVKWVLSLDTSCLGIWLYIEWTTPPSDNYLGNSLGFFIFCGKLSMAITWKNPQLYNFVDYFNIQL